MRLFYRIFLVLVFQSAFINQLSFSQTAPGIEWAKSLGGTQNETAYSIVQTTDGGYAVVGYTYSNDGDVSGLHDSVGSIPDYWLVKLDSIGNLQYQSCFGGTDDDEAYSIINTFDGGYLVTGLAFSLDGDIINGLGFGDVWILKFDSLFNIQWQKNLGGSNIDFANCMIQTLDSGYAIAAISDSYDGNVTGNHGLMDYWIVKTDETGNIQNEQCYGGLCIDWAASILQTLDGGYIVGGWTCSTDGDVIGMNGMWDYWILKFDPMLNLQWQKCLGGTGDDESYSSSIIQTSDGGFVTVGYAFSNDINVSGNHGANDYWVVKLDSLGSIIWQKCLGGTSIEECWSIFQTHDNGFILAGYSFSTDGDVIANHGNADYWIVKLNNIGDFQWQKCLGGTDDEKAHSIIQTSDYGYIIAGHSTSNDGDVSGNHGSADYWIVKLAPDTITGIIQHPYQTSNIQISPNPFTDELIVISNQFGVKGEIRIFDVTGKEILRQNTFGEETKINTGHLTAGFYFVKYAEENKINNFKVVKL